MGDTVINLEFSAGHCFSCLHEGRNDDLSEYILSFLDSISRHRIDRCDDDLRVLVDTFIVTFMACIVYAPYTIGRSDLAARLVLHNENLADLAAMSNFGDTDAALRIVLRQSNNIAKVLILYSARSKLRLNMKDLFDANPEAATLWYFAFIGRDFGKLADFNALDHLRYHYAHMDPRLRPSSVDMQHAYFGVTYAAPESERPVKERINRLVRAQYAEAAAVLNPRPEPDARHVAVLSAHWFAHHSVYRTNAKFVEALRKSYKITLVAMPHEGKPDLSLADDVIYWNHIDDFSPLAELNAVMAFYPDIGMTMHSIVLSNFRLAPIQIMSCGHPVSTFGSEIDYFLSGADIESAETARLHYSEQLALIPGRGVVANALSYPREFPEKPDQPVRILLSWAAQKVNHEMLLALREVAERCSRQVEFHFVSAIGLRELGRPAFSDSLSRVLGEGRAILHPQLSQAAYFALISHMHVAADSHPFGGFNTVVDPIYMGIPVIGFQGSRAFSQYGPHLLRTLGLDELVATDLEDYKKRLVRLVDDSAWRHDCERRIRALDLGATLFAEKSGHQFLQLVDFLVDHRHELAASGSRQPIHGPWAAISKAN